MSVVIVGGNERMERKYKDMCEDYGHTAKVFTKKYRGLKYVGSPDLVICFTDTMSHKMLRTVTNEIKGGDVTIEHSRTSSVSALKNILESYV